MPPKQSYECHHCKTTFTNKMKLQTHMKIHAQEDKLKCEAALANKRATRRRTPVKNSAGVKREKKEVAAKNTRANEAAESNNAILPTEAEEAEKEIDIEAEQSAAPVSDQPSQDQPDPAPIASGSSLPIVDNEVTIESEVIVPPENSNIVNDQAESSDEVANDPPVISCDEAKAPDTSPEKVHGDDNILDAVGALADADVAPSVPAPTATEVTAPVPIPGPSNAPEPNLTTLTKLDMSSTPSTSTAPDMLPKPPEATTGSMGKETIGSLLRKGTLFAHMQGEIASRVQSFLEETNTISSKRLKAKAAAASRIIGSMAQDQSGDKEGEKQDGADTVSCIECGVQFTDRILLLQHLACHTDLKIYSCEVCNKKFTRKYHMDRHKQMTACSGQPPPAHPCQVCGKVYTRKDNLREHLRAHAGEVVRKKRYKCDYCGKQYHGTSLLKIHVRTHTGEKPFQCEFCPKSFPSGGALTKHRRVHTGEKPYECRECGIRFSLKGTLNRHLRIHTGVRPHVCKFCGKQFIQAGGLKAHLFFHTGQNGFKCESCGKVFNRKARLQMHVRYVHEKIKPFDCSDCGKRFTRKEDLYRHYVLHTGEKPFECPTCLKRFSIKPSLKLHLLTHTKEEPRSCHECGRAFIRKDCLLRHMRKRHRDLLDKIFLDEKDEKLSNASTPGIPASRVMNEQTLCESIQELLSLLVDEPTLTGFGWPEKPVDELLEAVIRRCGHTPVNPEDYSYMDRLRENAKLLFTVVIDDNAVKTLLNNQTVDEVILHVLRLAKS